MGADLNPVLSVHPPEWREKWFSLIPGGRLCDPSELKGVSDAAIHTYAAQIADESSTGVRLPGL